MPPGAWRTVFMASAIVAKSPYFVGSSPIFYNKFSGRPHPSCTTSTQNLNLLIINYQTLANYDSSQVTLFNCIWVSFSNGHSFCIFDDSSIFANSFGIVIILSPNDTIFVTFGWSRNFSIIMFVFGYKAVYTRYN